MHSFRTPITIGSLAFASNICCSVLSAVGLNAVAVILNMLTWLCLLATGFWFYSNYSGQFADQAALIDDAARIIFGIIQTHVFAHLMGSPARPPGDKKDN